jgi:hydroxypyruvate isomerase
VKTAGKTVIADRFSVCIDMIMADREFGARIDAVAKLGYKAIEFWDWKSKDLDLIARKIDAHGLTVGTFCISPMCPIVDPATHKDFVAAVKESVKVAKRFGTKAMIVLTGNEIAGKSRDAQRDAVIAGLRLAAPVAEDAGVNLVLEPLNVLVDHKGYFLSRSDEAVAILDAVGSPNVRLLFDIYHQQITEGHLIPNITKHIDKIGHFHAADVPGRHEPGTGEINYANVLRAALNAGYAGWFGLEFGPSGEAAATLTKVRNAFSA